MTFLGRLVVGFVTSLILFIGSTAQYLMWIYFEGWNQDSLIFILFYNLFVFCVLYNYYLSCTVDPGRVPSKWEPDLNGPVLEVKRSTLKPRYCKTCRCYKPPRAHHCSTCERCVLKMDHHCPWLNNCVGYYNYGHFIRFIFYVDIACSMCFYVLVRRVLQLFDDSYIYKNRDNITPFELALLVLNLVGVVPVLLCVSMLSIFQFYGMAEGTTTIEGWEKDKVASLVRKGKVSEVQFPYDVGIYSNICSVLGDNVLLWCIPRAMRGDGLEFPVTQYTDEGTLVWPPPEYSRESGRKKRIHSSFKTDSDDPVVSSDYLHPGIRDNLSSYPSFIDSEHESDEASRFGEVSEDDSEFEADSEPSGIQLRSGGYSRLRPQPHPTDHTDTPYDSDNAPLGLLYQTNSLHKES